MTPLPKSSLFSAAGLGVSEATGLTAVSSVSLSERMPVPATHQAENLHLSLFCDLRRQNPQQHHKKPFTIQVPALILNLQKGCFFACIPPTLSWFTQTPNLTSEKWCDTILSKKSDSDNFILTHSTLKATSSFSSSNFLTPIFSFPLSISFLSGPKQKCT